VYTKRSRNCYPIPPYLIYPEGSDIVDNETREMFEKIIERLDRIDGRSDRQDGRFDRIEGRFDNLENEVKEFRAEMKDQIKGLDGKMNLICHKLKSDLDSLNNDPKQKYRIERED